jgi:hypothetical protein
MLHELDEEEADTLVQASTPEAELIHASVGEIGGMQFTTGLNPDFAAR